MFAPTSLQWSTSARKPADLIQVSHAYIGSTYVGWWHAYKNALARPEVKWRPFDEWVRGVKVNAMPLLEIPVNREVKYDTPQPAVPRPPRDTNGTTRLSRTCRRMAGSLPPGIRGRLVAGRIRFLAAESQRLTDSQRWRVS